MRDVKDGFSGYFVSGITVRYNAIRFAVIFYTDVL